MNRINLAAGVVFLVFSIVVMTVSRSMEYFSSLGPGPGFFPYWLGLLIAILSTIWIAQTLMAWRREAGTNAEFLPKGAGLVRVLSIVGALALIVLLMDTVGFQLSMLAFLVFLLIALGRVNPWLTIAVAVVGSFGLNYVFKTWLDVRLPLSSFSWLAGLGL